ncbi:helix-turn-helix domain-containing protein [Methylomicrobium agile]|uniref:helix-turn-helix domain-containing protein n=1 Tax=Methylomicrobium agile TaxID=39774 RepID=UPI0004DFA0CA|nr:helix-turn-helix transcriptional regulator [Methylomicrobium agile]
MNEIALRMKTLRAHRNLKQQELSDKSGISREAIAKIECGTTLWPSKEAVFKLSEALDTTPWYFLFGVVLTAQDMDPDVLDAAKVLQSLPKDKRKLLADTIKLIAAQ